MSVYVMGHSSPDTDSVASAIVFAHYLTATGTDAVPVVQSAALNPESELVLKKFSFSQPAEIVDAAGKDVALVDFSDYAQGSAGLSSANIVAVVDHHKIGDITTAKPIFFYAKPVGCTCTVLCEMYRKNGVTVPGDIAGLMLAAILSDTVNFKSPTCTEEDRQAVSFLAGLAGVSDTETLFMDMLKAKSAVEGVPARDLVFRDYKDFKMNGKKVGIAQLELASLDQVAGVKQELMAELKNLKEDGRHSILLMLTDVVKEGSELIVLSDEPELIEKAYNGKLTDNSMWVEGMMSRKKQTVPALQDLM